MNSDTALADLLRNADQAIQALVKKAFEEGVKRGREDAAKEVQATFDRLMSGLNPLNDPEIAPHGPIQYESGVVVRRAPPGTVRPAIIKVLREEEGGLRPANIAFMTGLSENTVRGTLRSMGIEGIVEKRGELWVLAKKDEPEESSFNVDGDGNPPHRRRQV